MRNTTKPTYDPQSTRKMTQVHS